jgi:hypothetical protein
MSTNARLQERPISQTILPRLRRTQELPALSFSHVPARSRRYTALSLHTQPRAPLRRGEKLRDKIETQLAAIKRMPGLLILPRTDCRYITD